MLKVLHFNVFEPCAGLRVGLLVSLLALMPMVSSAQIIWSGDFSTGDFSQWHEPDKLPTDPGGYIAFFHMPAYGRPIQYGYQNQLHVGNGDLMSLVHRDGITTNKSGVGSLTYPKGPTRGSSPYAARFTVRNYANHTAAYSNNDPNIVGDWDWMNQDSWSDKRRRTALNMQSTHTRYYWAMPQGKERWWSFSMYVPSDYEENAQTRWGGPGCGLKPLVPDGQTDMIDITISGRSWRIQHIWDEHYGSDMTEQLTHWQTHMFYTADGTNDNVPGPYPGSGPNSPGSHDAYWKDGELDYPDVSASVAALGNLNKGGWTDWVVHMLPDHRGSAAGGVGFMDIYKREGKSDTNPTEGPWVHVLRIRPRVTTRGGVTFDRGIGYNLADPEKPFYNGYGIKPQIYLGGELENFNKDLTVYYANMKVGDETATLSDMSPDGSSSDASVPPVATIPNPPTFDTSSP